MTIERAHKFELLKDKVLEHLLPVGTEVLEYEEPDEVDGSKIVFREDMPISVNILRDIICFNMLHRLDDIDNIKRSEVDKMAGHILQHHIRYDFHDDDDDDDEEGGMLA